MLRQLVGVTSGGAVPAARARFVERVRCIGCGGAHLRELSSGFFDAGAVGRYIAEDPWGEHPGPFLAGQPWSYVECAACGLTFHRYILSPEWNARRFERWMSQQAIADYEARRVTPAHRVAAGASYAAHALRIERLTRSLRGPREVRVLDFGCGYGKFLSACASYGFTAVGVDRSSARRKNGAYARIYQTLSEVEHLGPFDAVTLFEVLEHLDDPRAVLTQISRLLPAGGLLVLETPDCAGVRTIETRADYDKIHPLDHINGFTHASMVRLARDAGFTPVRKPLCVVESGPKNIAKAVARHFLRSSMHRSTRLYFRKA